MSQAIDKILGQQRGEAESELASINSAITSTEARLKEWKARKAELEALIADFAKEYPNVKSIIPTELAKRPR